MSGLLRNKIVTDDSSMLSLRYKLWYEVGQSATAWM